MSEAAEHSAVVGRDEELSLLRAQFGFLPTGNRRVVFISGEAGIGKTALMDAFCREVKQSSASVAHGQCLQCVSGKEEYYPLMESLSQLCASADGELACRILARMAPAWLTKGRAPESSTAAHAEPQVRLLGELCAALEELAAAKPLVLVFEDLHWADDSTLDFISVMARRRAPTRVMVLASCRRRKGATGHPLEVVKQDLLVHRLAVEIALAPLAKAAVCQLVIKELQQESLPPGLTGFVYQRSEGNPLFVIAVLEHLIAERFLVRKGTDDTVGWEQNAPLPEMESGVPGELTRMIELEIERLTPEEQRILEAGSLMSVAFPAWAVAAALELDAADAEEACDELARRLYFVERAGQDELPDGTRSAFYVFAHGLYREVLYQRQPATRRAKRQIRIAERLGTLFAGREACVAREMAMHYEAAGDWQRASSALRVAARDAQQRRAYADAMELLEQSLTIAQNLSARESETVKREIQLELMETRRETAMKPRLWMNVSE